MLMKFESILSSQVDMERVDLESIKPWITNKITEILNHDDDVVIDYVINQLEPQYPNPKEIQANLTGFFSIKNARLFLGDLWKHLLDNMQSISQKTNGKNTKATDDKPRNIEKLLPSPEHRKSLRSQNYNHRESSDKRDDQRRYRHRNRSNSSYSCSESYDRHSRRRRHSSSVKRRSRAQEARYTSGSVRRARRRSRSRSTSTGHTPYTRYSDYTDDHNRICISINSESPESASSSSSESSSESASSKSDDGSNSESVSINSAHIDNNDQIEECEDGGSEEKTDCEESDRNENKSSDDRLHDDGRIENTKMSRSSSKNTGRSIEESPQSMSSSSSSSSEYSIEYVERSQLMNEEEDDNEVNDGSDCSVSYSDIEWITADECDNRFHRCLEIASSLSSASRSSSSQSEDDDDEIVWLEEEAVRSMSAIDYRRL